MFTVRGFVAASLTVLFLVPFASLDLLAQQRRSRRPAADRATASPASDQEMAKETTQTKAAGNKASKVKPTIPDDWAEQIKWRSIGPANMMGRITALAVYEKDPCIWWAASASGGLIKTTNNGVTFEHQFDDQRTVSIGDVQVAQSNKDILWVGTGESNPRNSVSWGDGVYKSTDGGNTWKNMGLKKTFQTGAIAIHPEDPNVVYVGALGRLWGPNKERGLFKTTDGGKTWKKIFFVNDETGIIDVQMNPKNFDELLIATYERQRDGFDGNDPEKKYGAGSGIYKTTDAGASFTRVSKGLPTCKLGRIGLDYFRKDPNFVYAIVESEKIAKEPEDSPYLGLRASDADVGAKITSVVADGPSEKAGLKADDIVVSVDGAIVYSYQNMLGEIRKKRAGDKVKIIVSRDRKQTEVEIELEKKPKRPTRNGRTARTPFTGTLGGQAANLQDQQGETGHEYGGVYMSSDGGSTWERINSLNPRPMYYSHIRVDPTDRNHLYVCGTSLYKSKDGGKTFTGDGGSDGIHVDHHALWIDPNDARHMILGNDGGIYVTYDRMNHWTHHNQVALGQFYHAGVGPKMNYRVYGGLQDNGSWGGPSRTMNGSGSVNSDWFSVGGGDGFVTLVDPEDADQIYFESQNGGTGRINLRTGERGFIRPRPPRGTRYRFNWKTPFILSPHNSKVYYNAGNFVFRSFKKGDGIKAISPEITNSDKGAGSALSESPVEPGVLYVGTTDGAVWMTQDGGNEWQPISYSPEAKEEKKEEEKKEGDTEAKKEESKEAVADKDTKPESKEEKTEDPNDQLTGVWRGEMTTPRGSRDFEFTLKNGKEGSFTGEMENRNGEMIAFDGKFKQETGDISWVMESGRGEREYSAKIKDGVMTGEMVAGGGRFQIEFSAKRDKKDPAKSLELTILRNLSPVNAMLSANKQEDEISGTWAGAVESDDLPGGRIEFSIEMKMDEAGKISGMISSPQGDIDITEGQFNKDKKKIFMMADTPDGMGLEFNADLSGGELDGTVEINEGAMVADFSAKRTSAATEAEEPEAETETETEEMPEAKQQEVEKKKDMEPEVATPAQPAQEKAADDDEQETQKAKEEADKEEAVESEDESQADDPVSGEWKGVMISEQRGGEQDLQLNLVRKSNKNITGTYETARGEGEISEGQYDPETKKLSVLADNGRFTLEFVGKVGDEKFNGDLDFNGGQFSMSFELERKSKATPEATDEEEGATKDADEKKSADAKKDSKSKAKAYEPVNRFEGMLPGPRWVSSIDASHFEAGRCYISFDGHRSDDDMPYVFATEDFGKTWKSIRANLPDHAGSVRVIREDIENENLLYLGCEFSAWFSVDRGKSWTQFKGLPTVAVHEIAIHPKAGEIVAATHGRSLWVANVTQLRQMSEESVKADLVLYQPADVIRWRRTQRRGSNGVHEFKSSNATGGATICYSLSRNVRSLELEIVDLTGRVVKRFEDAETRKGLHTVQWDLRTGTNQGNRRFGGATASTGKYLVRIRAGNDSQQKELSIQPDPNTPSDTVAEDLIQHWDESDSSYWLRLMDSFGSNN